MSCNDPKTISIHRASKSWAVFGTALSLEKPFTAYANEAEAIAEARAWVRERTKTKPVIVYPRITKIRASSK